MSARKFLFALALLIVSSLPLSAQVPTRVSILELVSLTADLPAGFPCVTGKYYIWSNGTTLKLRKCENGALSDLDTVGAGGAPGGANTQVQFNDASTFAGDPNFTWNKTTDVLSVSNILGIPFVDDVKFTTIDSAEADCTTLPCLLVVRSAEGAGDVTRSTWNETVAILDLRGDEGEPFGIGAAIKPHIRLLTRKTADVAGLDVFPAFRSTYLHDSGGQNVAGG
ncbi:MAG: hypothetical protein L0Z53_13470, partial [Acidobacteriales bacterium]|nr:hypothetical protein [Terriglobales bacterium]